jgi:thiol-disulfide isomerase/thioredoxin
MSRIVHLLTYLAISFTVYLISAFAPVTAQEYSIKFKINGLKDTTCLIAYYYASSTYIKDTVLVDGSGRCTYKAPADLPKGLYVFVINDKTYFDFVINNDRKFSMETSRANPSEHMVIRESPDNELFYQYLKNNREKYDLIQKIQDEAKNAGDPKDTTGVYSTRINEVNKELISYRLDLVKKYPDSFIAFMINAMKEPEVPDPPVLPGGRIDSAFSYRYYKAHYWDGTNFTDDRLLRTPVFYNKLKKYFSSLVVQNPDSVIREVDEMIERTRPNEEMFKYMVWFTTYQYENPEYMGFDKVFVHIVDTYYISGQVTWLNPTVKENIIKKANKIRPLLLGEVAPNMIMVDTNNQLVSMHAIQARFLVILFWDPECGHCEKEIPVIKTLYDTYREKYNLEVLAVCSDTSLVKWKKAIQKKNMTWINVDGPRTLTGDYHEQYDISSTPVIYLLNDRKEIIAKRLPAEKIEMFIENYIRKEERDKKKQ